MFKYGCIGFLSWWILLSVHPAMAQQALVKATVNKSKILLGEPLELVLEIRSPANTTMAPFKVDSIPHFEILKKDSLVRDTVGGAALIRQYFQLTSFDSGRWVIPPFVLKGTIRTAAIFVEVVFTEPFDPQQPYHDIQDIRTVPFQMGKTFEKWWYLIALLLVICTLLIYAMTGEKKPPTHDKKLREGAYARAKRQLEALHQSRMPQNQYYPGLVEIFRGYLRERTGIDSLQQTSGDLVQKIHPLFNDAGRYESLAQVLSLCDLVKFAKYNPQDPEAQSAYEVVHASIEHIESNLKKGAGLAKATTLASPGPGEETSL